MLTRFEAKTYIIDVIAGILACVRVYTGHSGWRNVDSYTVIPFTTMIHSRGRMLQVTQRLYYGPAVLNGSDLNAFSSISIPLNAVGLLDT